MVARIAGANHDPVDPEALEEDGPVADLQAPFVDGSRPACRFCQVLDQGSRGAVH
jgi:hypothetical protein